jgi:hypothetical protein
MKHVISYYKPIPILNKITVLSEYLLHPSRRSYEVDVIKEIIIKEKEIFKDKHE